MTKLPIVDPQTTEEKELNWFFALAAAARSKHQQPSEHAVLRLRKLFYHYKRLCETIQEEGRLQGLQGQDFWAKAPEKRKQLAAATLVCRRIAGLFSDLRLSLHERAGRDVTAPAPAPTITAAPQEPQDQDNTTRLPSRVYTGLGDV